jgi:hypothetical protein
MASFKKQHLQRLCVSLTLALNCVNAAADPAVRSYHFDIAAETLSQALRSYGQVSRQQISFSKAPVSQLSARRAGHS